MDSDKNLKLVFYGIPILLIFFGFVSILLSYFIFTFRIDRLLRDIVVITIGFMILVMLSRSELVKYNWKNGRTLFNFFFLFFSVLIISQIIRTIFEPVSRNLFLMTIIVFLTGILFNTLRNLKGTYFTGHNSSSTAITGKVEDLLKSKKAKYKKIGPKRASIKNLIEFDESIELKRWNIYIDISSRGIIIGKINSSNKSKIERLMNSLNKELEKV